MFEACCFFVFVKAGISRMPVKWQNDITCQVRLVTGSKLQLTCWSLSMTKLHWLSSIGVLYIVCY